jgi:hypothetical protein
MIWYRAHDRTRLVTVHIYIRTEEATAIESTVVRIELKIAQNYHASGVEEALYRSFKLKSMMFMSLLFSVMMRSRVLGVEGGISDRGVATYQASGRIARQNDTGLSSTS